MEDNLLKLKKILLKKLVLSKVNKFIKIEFDELWEWEDEINNLNPNLEPLTIITNIISKDERDKLGKWLNKI